MNKKIASGIRWQELLHKYLIPGIGVGAAYGGTTSLLRQFRNIAEDAKRKKERLETDEDAIVVKLPEKKAILTTSIGYPLAVAGAFGSSYLVRHIAHKIREKQLKNEVKKQKEKYYNALHENAIKESSVVDSFIPQFDLTVFSQPLEKSALFKDIISMVGLSALAGTYVSSTVAKKILDKEVSESEKRTPIKQPIRNIVFRYEDKKEEPVLVAEDKPEDEKEASSFSPLTDTEKLATFLTIGTVAHFMKHDENPWRSFPLEKSASAQRDEDPELKELDRALELIKQGDGSSFKGNLMGLVGNLMKKFPSIGKWLFDKIGQRWLKFTSNRLEQGGSKHLADMARERGSLWGKVTAPIIEHTGWGENVARSYGKKKVKKLQEGTPKKRFDTFSKHMPPQFQEATEGLYEKDK